MYGHGSGAYLSDLTDFSYNKVLTNTATGGTSGGISISGQPLLQYNNLYGNLPYDAEVVSSQPITGTLNYWGLSSCTAIPLQIYDGNDAPGRGILSYAPSLYQPAPLAQLPVPANMILTNSGSTVTIGWSATPPIPNVGCQAPGSSVPAVVYRLYYDIDNGCAPYAGHGLVEGPSPIAIGPGTTYTVHGLSPVKYYFTVTANDYLGRQSAFANAVVRPTLYLPSLMR
jgi:hypothetical protein